MPSAAVRSARAAAPGSSVQTTSAPPGASRSTKSSNTAPYASALPKKSRWSASMLVTTATFGVYSSSEPSLSSASATKQSPLPWWALVPASPRSPPTANDGSKPDVLQGDDEHRGRRGLAVGAGDHQRGVAVHQPGQHDRPQDHRDRRGAWPRRVRGWSSGSPHGWSPPRSARRAAGPVRTRRGRCGSPRPVRAAPPLRATPWRRSPTPARRGPAGCGRCPTCRLRRCRPCAPAAVRRAGRWGPASRFR